MAIETSPIFMQLPSGKYRVLFSDDADRPQDLIVRDERGVITALTKDEIAQLYAIHHFLHGLDSTSTSILGDKLFAADERMARVRNTLDQREIG